MRTIVILSGAGLSAESGISTFRDSDGLWENHRIEDVASLEGWQRNQSLVLEFYGQRFENFTAAKPNEAHRSIARLEEKFEVINITQNVDTLLEQAGCKDVKHIHGSFDRLKCERHKSCSMLDGDRKYTCDYTDVMTAPIKVGDLCPTCGGQLRPNIVWFGEPVAYDFEAKDLVKEVKYNNGVFIAIGTSAAVVPAAVLIPFFAQVDNKYIVNIKTHRIANYTLLEGLATVKMKELADQLLEEEEAA